MSEEIPPPPPLTPPPVDPPQSLQSPVPPMPPPSGARLPWEDRQRLGFMPALIETVKMVITQPQEAFSRIRQDGDLVSPILFGLIVGFVGAVFSQVWSLAFNSSMGLLSGLGNDSPFEGLMVMGGTGVGVMLIILVLFPLYYLLGLFIGSGIYHLVLHLLGGLENSDAGFEGSLKTVAYSAPASLSAVIPVVGGFIGAIWALVLYVIGLAAVHKTTHLKAFLAILIPFILCCICGVVAIALFGASIAGLAAAANG